MNRRKLNTQCSFFFIDANESFLDFLTFLPSNAIIKLNPSEDAFFVVKYPSNLILNNDNFSIRDNRNNIIEWTKVENNKKRKIAYHLPKEKSLIIIIRNMVITDSGRYTLIVNNGKETKQVTFRLKVENNSSGMANKFE